MKPDEEIGIRIYPRTLDMENPRVQEPDKPAIGRETFEAPLQPEESARVKLEKGPNIVSLPESELLRQCQQRRSGP
jgi:hypothetical protein